MSAWLLPPGASGVVHPDTTGTRDLVYDTSKPWQLAGEALDTFYGSRLFTPTDETALSTNTGDSSYTGHTLGSVPGRAQGLQVGTTSTPTADLEFITRPRFLAGSGSFPAPSARNMPERYEPCDRLQPPRGWITIGRTAIGAASSEAANPPTISLGFARAKTWFCVPGF